MSHLAPTLGAALSPLLNVTELYSLAEEKIKQVEKLSRELPFPAVNELRYAGRHLIDYLATGSKEQLVQAENHCKRAIYDAVEAGVTFQLLQIQAFNDDFRMLILKDHITAYPELRIEINRAKALITESKPEDQSKMEYYEECSRHLERLTEIHELLEAHRDDLIAVLQRHNEDVLRRNEETLQRNADLVREEKKHRTIVAIAAATLVATVVGVLIAWNPSPKDAVATAQQQGVAAEQPAPPPPTNIPSTPAVPPAVSSR